MTFPAEWLHTVTAQSVTTVKDKYGDGTAEDSGRVVSEVLYAPEGISDTPGSPVVGEASLYGAFPLLDADDTVIHGSTCCDGALFPRGTWQVVGGAKGWAPGKMVVPIRRTGDV